MNDEFKKYGRTYIIKNLNLVYLIASFNDIAIANTLATYNQYHIIKNFLPTIWWIREAPSYMDRNIIIPKIVENADNIYTMSDLSKNDFLKFNKNISVIKHGIPDNYNNKKISIDKLSFAIIGTIERRKGHDILISAIENLPKTISEKASFYILGRSKDKNYFNNLKLNKFNNIKYIPEITNKSELLKFYEDISCVIVPSREEPTSRVAIEAMMMGRPVIMSNKVGAQYLINDKNGFIFNNEDYKELSSIIKNIIKQPKLLLPMEEEARKAYLCNNSIHVYKQNLITMLNKYINISAFKFTPKIDNRKLTLSIVVPVYNALTDLI